MLYNLQIWELLPSTFWKTPVYIQYCENKKFHMNIFIYLCLSSPTVKLRTSYIQCLLF
jgi:hypothetical protein